MFPHYLDAEVGSYVLRSSTCGENNEGRALKVKVLTAKSVCAKYIAETIFFKWSPIRERLMKCIAGSF
jgi:hypothetical protein